MATSRRSMVRAHSGRSSVSIAQARRCRYPASRSRSFDEKRVKLAERELTFLEHVFIDFTGPATASIRESPTPVTVTTTSRPTNICRQARGRIGGERWNMKETLVILAVCGLACHQGTHF